MGDARFDGPMALVRVEAVDGHDARRRLVARNRPMTSVLWVLPVAATTTAATIASWTSHTHIFS